VSRARLFESNANKDYLRRSFDKQVVERWFKDRGAPLHYLGLPGPEILDIVEWQEYIGQFTTIERGADEQHLILLRTNVRDIEHRLHSLYGEFDEILLTGRARYNHMPRWPYDLVNLDFFGGLLYRDLSRPKAIRKLIENQEEYGRSFLLIITYHIRDADLAGEKVSFVDDLQRKLERDLGRERQISEWADWYRRESTPDVARQSLYLNTVLYEEGETAHFEVHCRPVVLYSGTGGARMLHMVSDFKYQTGAHRAVSAQSLLDVVNLGYVELNNEAFTETVRVPRLKAQAK
jgi:hypothetical protein